MPKKMKKHGDPEVHEDLKGFDIKINTFGELHSNYEVDKLNDFLNDKIEDKKINESGASEDKDSD